MKYQWKTKNIDGSCGNSQIVNILLIHHSLKQLQKRGERYNILKFLTRKYHRTLWNTLGKILAQATDV